jgi:hypothetical protein
MSEADLLRAREAFFTFYTKRDLPYPGRALAQQLCRAYIGDGCDERKVGFKLEANPVYAGKHYSWAQMFGEWDSEFLDIRDPDPCVRVLTLDVYWMFPSKAATEACADLREKFPNLAHMVIAGPKYYDETQEIDDPDRSKPSLFEQLMQDLNLTSLILDSSCHRHLIAAPHNVVRQQYLRPGGFFLHHTRGESDEPIQIPLGGATGGLTTRVLDLSMHNYPNVHNSHLRAWGEALEGWFVEIG